MASLFEFEGCCTACILHDLTEYPYTEERIEQCIRSAINEWMDGGGEYEKGGMGAVIVATTTTLQVKVNRVLKKLGFIPTSPMKKERHPESELILWRYELLTKKGNRRALAKRPRK